MPRFRGMSPPRRPRANPCAMATLALLLILVFVFTATLRSGGSRGLRLLSGTPTDPPVDYEVVLENLKVSHEAALNKNREETSAVRAELDAAKAAAESAGNAATDKENELKEQAAKLQRTADKAKGREKKAGERERDMQQRAAILEHSEAELRQWKLTHAMCYWAHSDPVPKPSGVKMYDEPGMTHYITWEHAHDGVHNIRLQVEALVMMAHLFKRTLVMPSHLLNFLEKSEGGEVQSSVAAFFDFQDLSRWTSVITMQQYLDIRGVNPDSSMRDDQKQVWEWLREGDHSNTSFPQWNFDTLVLAVPDRAAVEGREYPTLGQFAGDKQVSTYEDEQKQATTLHIKFDLPDFSSFGNLAAIWYFPSQASQDYHYAGLRDHFHFHRDIFANASKVVDAIRQKFSGRNFDAVYDRADDFGDKNAEQYVDRDVLKDRLIQVLGTDDISLYISTSESNRTRYEPLMEAYPDHVFLSDIVEDALPGCPPTFLDPIEQVVCSVAARFVGTFGSTSSGYIHRLRGYHHQDLVPNKAVYFTNSPKDADDYTKAVENNEAQTDISWWDQGTGAIHSTVTWAREFSTTWDFHRSELRRESLVFDHVG